MPHKKIKRVSARKPHGQAWVAPLTLNLRVLWQLAIQPIVCSYFATGFPAFSKAAADVTQQVLHE
jgi:hypothetical protein